VIRLTQTIKQVINRVTLKQGPGHNRRLYPGSFKLYNGSEWGLGCSLPEASC